MTYAPAMGGFFSRLFGKNSEPASGFSLVWEDVTTRPRSGRSHPQSWDQIEAILRGLEGSEGFVILSTQPQRYMQAAAGIDGLIVEYRDGSAGGHYACVDPLTMPRVTELFKAYFEDAASIHEKGRWHKVQI